MASPILPAPVRSAALIRLLMGVAVALVLWSGCSYFDPISPLQEQIRRDRTGAAPHHAGGIQTVVDGDTVHAVVNGGQDMLHSFVGIRDTSYLIAVTCSFDAEIMIYDSGAVYSIFGTGSSTNPWLVWRCSATGTYCFTVSADIPENSGSYAVSVTTVRFDAFEPDDSSGAATPVVANSRPQPHTMMGGDTDYVKFAAVLGMAYTVNVTSWGMSVVLYGTDGRTVIAADAQLAPWVCTSSGIYYLSVSSNSSLSAGIYSISIFSSPAVEPDWFEPQDGSLATATTIVPDSNAQIHTLQVGDVDFFQFPGIQGTTYVVSTFGSTDTRLDLWPENGIPLLASVDDFGGDKNARIDWACPAAGWYKFRVSPGTDSTFGAYTVSVTRQ